MLLGDVPFETEAQIVAGYLDFHVQLTPGEMVLLVTAEIIPCISIIIFYVACSAVKYLAIYSTVDSHNLTRVRVLRTNNRTLALECNSVR